MTYDHRLAAVYDLIYHLGGMKDYDGEAAAIADLIYSRCPDASSLLDVACGTGLHLQGFARRFAHVEGADLSEAMQAIAAARNPGVPVHRADMRSLGLGRTFSAVTCLFSSIGYLSTEAELRQALQVFAEHTEPGGVVLVEPWFTPEQWQHGTVHTTSAEGDGQQLIRMAYSTTEGDHSVMDMHYLHGRRGSGVQHWTDRHRMSLFTAEQYEHAFTAAGLTKVQWVPGWRTGRDRLIAVKPVAQR